MQIHTSVVKVKVNNAPEGDDTLLGVYRHSVQLLAMDQLQMNHMQTASVHSNTLSYPAEYSRLKIYCGWWDAKPFDHGSHVQ